MIPTLAVNQITRVQVRSEGVRDWRWLWLRRRGCWLTVRAGTLTGASWSSDGSTNFTLEDASRHLARRRMDA